MAEMLKYEPDQAGNSLAPVDISNHDTFFSGDTEYRLQDTYVITRGIKKGIGRARAEALLPGEYENAQSAVLEVSSNNLLPGLTAPDGHTQYVKFRGGTALARQQEPTNADILISLCLFGVTGNALRLADGRHLPITSPKSAITSPVEELIIDDQLSIYEVEAIERQTNFLDAISKNNPTYSSVTIGLPRVGYYLHALKPYTEGFISPEHTTAWFDAVDERYSFVLEAIKKRLPSHLDVHVKSPLDLADETMRKIVNNNKPMELEPLLKALAENDPLWARVLERNTPTGLYQLKGDFADAVEEIRMPSSAINARAIIKSPKEEGTFELSGKISTAMGIAPPLVAMYALPQVVTMASGPGLYQIPRMPSRADIDLISAQY